MEIHKIDCSALANASATMYTSLGPSIEIQSVGATSINVYNCKFS
jgi:hypothetical protein